MKQLIAVFIFSLFFVLGSKAQKYYTKNAKISFFSKTKFENIKADNNQVTTTLNIQTGELLFSVLNNAFHFENALMEDHFNADYIESTKFPRSTFKGMVSNISAVNPEKDGNYPVTVTGEIFIHGVMKSISTTGIITVKNGKVSATAVFPVKPKDFNIKIPGAVRNNIAETIELSISCAYDKRG